MTSEPVQFSSDFSLSDSVERLREVVKPLLFSIGGFREIAVGRVSERRVYVRRFNPLIRNPLKPFFVGRFKEESGQLVLEGKFALHFLSKAFITGWLCFFGLFALITFNQNAKNGNLGLAVVSVFVSVIIGVGTVWLFRRSSQSDIPWLAAVIRGALSRDTNRNR